MIIVSVSIYACIMFMSVCLLCLWSYDLFVCMSCMSVFVLLYNVYVVCVCVCVCLCVCIIVMSVRCYPCMMFMPVCLLCLYDVYACMAFMPV